MKKASTKQSGKLIQEIEPFDKRTMNISKLKPDLSEAELTQLLVPAGRVVAFPFQAIETLSVTKTRGLGRTNLTFIAPTIVQVDSATPSATFDVRAQTRHPAIQMHFEPSAYGITSVASYIMEFTVQVFGQSTFNLAGGPVPVSNGGTKVLNGQAKVSLVFPNVPPTQQCFGFLEETAGVAWSWFSVQLRFPPIIALPTISSPL